MVDSVDHRADPGQTLAVRRTVDHGFVRNEWPQGQFPSLAAAEQQWGSINTGADPINTYCEVVTFFDDQGQPVGGWNGEAFAPPPPIADMLLTNGA
jgi:hypothetical protein